VPSSNKMRNSRTNLRPDAHPKWEPGPAALLEAFQRMDTDGSLALS
jgi:hypothetical protein